MECAGTVLHRGIDGKYRSSYRGIYTPFRPLLNKRHWRLAMPNSRASTDFGSLLRVNQKGRENL